jgi:50S ribosomal subunit-associated GTPase HflX
VSSSSVTGARSRRGAMLRRCRAAAASQAARCVRTLSRRAQPATGGAHLLVVQPRGPDADAQLAEALRLVETLPGGRRAAHALVQRVRAGAAATYFGAGTVEAVASQLADAASSSSSVAVVVNVRLTGAQERNLSAAWHGARVLDRVGLIIDVFAARAVSREAAIQVQLARIAHDASRLVRGRSGGFGDGGTAAVVSARQRGGGGGQTSLGGEGETELTLQRRRLSARRGVLQAQLADVARTRSLHRAGRVSAAALLLPDTGLPASQFAYCAAPPGEHSPPARVALVGYTNAGKSSLAAALCAAAGARAAQSGFAAGAADRLFATLDTTTRAAPLPSRRRMLLSDTVGFIRDLPAPLVAAFRSTLAEVLEADVLVHVVDASLPPRLAAQQRAAVRDALRDLGVRRAQCVVEAWNKARSCLFACMCVAGADAHKCRWTRRQQVKTLTPHLRGGCRLTQRPCLWACLHTRARACRRCATSSTPRRSSPRVAARRTHASADMTITVQIITRAGAATLTFTCSGRARRHPHRPRRRLRRTSRTLLHCGARASAAALQVAAAARRSPRRPRSCGQPARKRTYVTLGAKLNANARGCLARTFMVRAPAAKLTHAHATSTAQMQAAAAAAVRQPPDQPKTLRATPGEAPLLSSGGGAGGDGGAGRGGGRALCAALKPYTRGSSAARRRGCTTSCASYSHCSTASSADAAAVPGGGSIAGAASIPTALNACDSFSMSSSARGRASTCTHASAPGSPPAARSSMLRTGKAQQPHATSAALPHTAHGPHTRTSCCPPDTARSARHRRSACRRGTLRRKWRPPAARRAPAGTARTPPAATHPARSCPAHTGRSRPRP